MAARARPLVAVTPDRLAEGVVRWWGGAGWGLSDRYLAALRRGGVDPVLWAPDPDDPSPGAVPAWADGLVLTGGPDVGPAAYGAAPHPATVPAAPARDAHELGLARAAAGAGVPTLAICRGLQVLNVALGGTLEQHLPDRTDQHHGATAEGGASTPHPVRVEPGSRLAGALGGAAVLDGCPSRHHQAVATLAAGLHVTARADDGTIEAVEPAPTAPWLLAVQWHPERAEGHPGHEALFTAFAAACRR